MTLRERIESLARKYDQAHEAVHPEEVVADLTTILEGDGVQLSAAALVDQAAGPAVAPAVRAEAVRLLRERLATDFPLGLAGG